MQPAGHGLSTSLRRREGPLVYSLEHSYIESLDCFNPLTVEPHHTVPWNLGTSDSAFL
jgi:hypothetical protein